MGRVIHFEIHATDPDRAIKFYTDTFDWKIQKWEGGNETEYWMIETGPKEEPGINGGLLKRNVKLESGSPSGFVCVIEVPSVDEYMEKVKKNGGVIIIPKIEIKDVGCVAYCNDTEGNIIGMLEYGKSEVMNSLSLIS